MTRQNINVGTNEGQGDGDSLRTAFQKINDNFVELYSGALRGYTGSGGFNGYIGSTGYVGSVGLAADAAVTNFGTFLSPSGYTLQIRRGSILDRTSFTPAEGELIYSTNTKRLYIGDGVTPGGNIISGTVGYTGSGGGGAGGGGYIGSIGPIGYTGSPGGGGGGGTTSTLVAGTATLSINTLSETVLPSGLRFEPIENYGFGFGGTIAMQTYGEQLQMLATGTGAFGLFGYGEVIGGPGGVAYLVGNQDGTNEVKIVAGSYTATVNTWEFKNNGDLIIPNAILGSGNQALVVQNTASGVAYLELPVDPSIDSVILANQAVSSATVTIRVGDFGSERNWTFNEFGSLAVPGIIYNTDPSNVGQLLLAGAPGESATYLALPSDVGSTSMNVRLANSNGGIQLYAGTSTWLFNNTGDLELPGGSVLATGGYDVALVAGNDGNSTFGTVVISTQYPPDLTDRNWTFNSLGELYLPQGGAIQETEVTNELWGTTTTSLTLVPGGAGNGTQRLEIYATGGGEGDHIHITSGDQNQTDLFLGNDTQYFAVAASGENRIQARDGTNSPSPGTSAGPGANVNIYGGNAGDNGGNVADGASGGDVFLQSGISTSGLGGSIYLASSSGPDGFGFIRISTDGGSTNWTFGTDGNLTLPGDIRSESNINIDINLSDSTLRRWRFGEDGNLNLAGNLQFPVGAEIRESGSGELRLRGAAGQAAQLQGLDDSGFVDSAVKALHSSGVGSFVTINTNIDASEHIWSFDYNGDLTVPNYINFAGNTFIGDEPGAGTPYFRINTPLGYAATITTDSDISGNNWSWTFGEDGNLTLPGELHGAPVMSVGPTPSQVGRTVNITPADDASDKKFRFRVDQYAGQTFTRAYLELPTAEVDKQVAAVFPHANGTAAYIYTQGADSYDDGLNNAFNIFYNAGDIKLTAMTPVTGTFNTWTFDKDSKLTTPGAVSVGGILKIEDGVHEKFQTKSNATGTVTHDCSSGHIFYHTLPSANWTVNLTNLNLAVGYATAVTLVIEQGATGRYPSAVQVDGNAVPLAWQGNTTPTPSSNRFDVVTFSILYDGLYTVLGQLTGF